MRADQRRPGSASTLIAISCPTDTFEASLSRTKAVSQTVERSPITKHRIAGAELTYWPGPTLRCTTVPVIGEKMVVFGLMLPFS
jgi:hypothetical protein